MARDDVRWEEAKGNPFQLVLRAIYKLPMFL
jgi:hypothetical protein